MTDSFPRWKPGSGKKLVEALTQDLQKPRVVDEGARRSQSRKL